MIQIICDYCDRSKAKCRCARPQFSVLLDDVLALLDADVEYATPIYDPYDSVGRERARLRAELGAE